MEEKLSGWMVDCLTGRVSDKVSVLCVGSHG